MDTGSPNVAPVAATRPAPTGGDLLAALSEGLLALLPSGGERPQASGDGADLRAAGGDPSGVLLCPQHATGPAHRTLAPRRLGTLRHDPHAHHRAHEGADHRGQPAATHSVHGSTLRASLPEVSVE